MESPSPNFKSGYVAIIGWPNSGKSTLLNALVGTKLSIVSPKPQTTRQSILGIANEKNAQILFVDTPGWLKPQDPYQSFMKRAILRTLFDDADVIVWLLDPRPLNADQKVFMASLDKSPKPLIVAINKVDTVQNKELLLSLLTDLKAGFHQDAAFLEISAKTGQGLGELKEQIRQRLPVSPPYFPTDQITDRWERFYVSELIREALFSLFRDEVPHASFVKIDDFTEKKGTKDQIRALIFVETEGQKQIVIGRGGKMIKAVGQESRHKIESFLGRPVYLELLVRVRKNWRKDPVFLKENFVPGLY